MAQDLFAPRKALTRHLQQLVEIGVLREVAQAELFAEVMSGATPIHQGAYIAYDGYSNVSTQGHNSQKLTQKYSVILAWRNQRPARSNHSHGMDEAGITIAKIINHVEGLAINERFGKRFTLTQGDEAFYRPSGWAFYPIAFSIDIINIKDKP